MGQVGVDDGAPFRDTGVARHRYPPWGYGVDATSRTMLQRRMSCHLCDDAVPSFFKNLPQKALWERVRVRGFVPGTAGALTPALSRGERELYKNSALSFIYHMQYCFITAGKFMVLLVLYGNQCRRHGCSDH